MRWLRHAARCLRRRLAGVQLDEAIKRNRRAAEDLDRAVREVLAR